MGPSTAFTVMVVHTVLGAAPMFRAQIVPEDSQLMITSASDRTPNETMDIVRTNSMSRECDGFLDEIAKHLFFVYFFVCFFIWHFSLALVFRSHGQVLPFYPLILKTELFLALVRFFCFHVPFTVLQRNCKKKIVLAKLQFDNETTLLRKVSRMRAGVGPPGS